MEVSVLGEASLDGVGILEAKFDDFGRFLAVLTLDKICTLYDVSNGGFTEILRSQLHPLSLSIAWTNPKFGQHIIVSLASGSIQVMKLTITQKLSTMTFVGETPILNEYPSTLNVGNAENDMFVALGSAGGKIGILSLKTNELSGPFDAHFGGVTALCFDNNCNNLFSVGHDSRLVKWSKVENTKEWNKVLSIKTSMPMNSVDYLLGEIITSHSTKVFIYNDKGDNIDTFDINSINPDDNIDLGNKNINKVSFHGHQSIAVALESNTTLIFTKDDGKYKFIDLLNSDF